MSRQTHQSEAVALPSAQTLPVDQSLEPGQVQPQIPVLMTAVHRPKGTKIRLERSVDQLWIQCPNPGLFAAFKTRLLLLLLLLLGTIGGCIQLELQYGSLTGLIQALAATPALALKELFVPLLGWTVMGLAGLMAAIGFALGLYTLRSPVCIHLNPNRLLVYKQLGGLKFKLLTQAISKLEHVSQRTVGRVGRTKYRGVTLRVGTIDYSFGIGLSREECTWLVREIQSWLQQR